MPDEGGEPTEPEHVGDPDRPVRDAAGRELSERELQEWDPMPEEIEDGVAPTAPGEDPMKGPAPSG